MVNVNLERKGFIWHMLPYHCSSVKEIHTGTQSGKEPEARSWYRGHGILLFNGFFSLLSYKSKTIVPAMSPPTRVWALFHQSLDVLN